ncbi:MAG: hypothetical protein MR428_08290 [Mesosutterella sp.]|nr:hypothetical protein [Mesosutterella sp.]
MKQITRIAAACLAAAAAGLLSLNAVAADAQKKPDGVSAATKQAPAEKPDAISGATKKRESHSGAIKLTETAEGQKLLREMVRDFIYTGDTVFDGHKVKGGRQMFAIGTADLNTPEVITAELTPDYNEATGKFVFYGTTAKDSGKILRASRSGTGLSVAWVKQLRPNELKNYGWNYYDSYGISFKGDLKVYRGRDLTGDEAHDRPILDHLSHVMDRSLTTIKEWSLIWKFSPTLKGKALQDAKDREIRDFLTYEDVYEVTPTSMIVIDYFARPLMVNPNNAFVYKQYAINSNEKGFNLLKSKGYKAALRDTNCANVMLEPERSRYTFFDQRYPRTSPMNLLNRLSAYKNKAVFGSAKPANGAKPTADGLKIVENQYNNKGQMSTKAEVDQAVKAAEGKKKTYFWVDESKRASMPDRYMVTYTGRDSNGKAYRVDLPNWNRWFVLHPNNVCGIATRQTIEFNK